MNIITFHLLAEFTSVIIKTLKEGQIAPYQVLLLLSLWEALREQGELGLGLWTRTLSPAL